MPSRNLESLIVVLMAVVLLTLALPASSAGEEAPAIVHDITCELVWEAPGETADYLLGGLLVDAGFDHDGNLCVVDYRNKDLKVFDRQGRYLRTLGRAGDGPGESRDARRLLLAEDGRLGLLQVFPAAVVWLRGDGTPGGKQTITGSPDGSGGFVAVTHAVQHGATILAYATSMAMLGGEVHERHWIAPLQADGSLGAPLFKLAVEQPARDAQNRVDEGDYYDLWAARWAPDGCGGVWLAPERDRYTLVRHGADGEVVTTVTRRYTPPRRDDLGRRQALEHLGRKRLTAEEVKLRDHGPVVRSLRLSEAGSLWVDLDLGGRGPAPGTIAWIDVVDADGRHEAQLRLSGPYDPETDQWRFVDDTHVLVLHAGSEEEIVLRLLRWRRPD